MLSYYLFPNVSMEVTCPHSNSVFEVSLCFHNKLRITIVSSSPKRRTHDLLQLFKEVWNLPAS